MHFFSPLVHIFGFCMALGISTSVKAAETKQGVSLTTASDSSQSEKDVANSLFTRKANGKDFLIYDALIKNGAPVDALTQAFQYFDRHPNEFTNKKTMALADFSQCLGDQRFFVLDLVGGQVKKMQVSHGLGSDPGLKGCSTQFSDENQSYKSSVGFYKTLDTYTGEYGHSLHVKGLSESNRSALAREVVVHPYDIGPGYSVFDCRAEKIRRGRPASQKYCLPEGDLTRGCFGIPRAFASKVVDELAGGALIYAFSRK